MKKLPLLVIIALALVASVFVVGIGFYSYVNGLRSEALQYETTLNAQYLDNQNELSGYISSFYEQTGLANRKSEKMNQILLDAVRGRYEANGTPVQRGTGTPMFSAIVEAYPDLQGLNIYDKIVDFVSSGREAYKSKQTKLLDQLRVYDRWRQDGIVQSWILRNWMGVPTEMLEARIGTAVVRGSAARDQMYLIVLTPGARDAYQTGSMAPLEVK